MPSAVDDDLTARARIRAAALAQFTEQGYERSTIRGIAAAAGVSLGLVRHHFGSKQALRDAVDAHVLAEIRRISEAVRAAGDSGDFTGAAVNRAAVLPFQGYVARALLDGSPAIAGIFDWMVAETERWLARSDAGRADRPHADRRTRAAVFTAMALGVPILHEHLSRVLGVDTYAPDGDRKVAAALLDIYSHPLVTPDLAAAAGAALNHHPASENRKRERTRSPR